MKRILTLTALGALALSMGPAILMTPGCSTANRIAYVGETTGRVSVETGMGLFNQAIIAGKVTPAQEQKVKNIYNKLRLSMMTLCDVGKAGSAAASTNGVTAFSDAISQASADFQQDLSDLRAALAEFNINI